MRTLLLVLLSFSCAPSGLSTKRGQALPVPAVAMPSKHGHADVGRALRQAPGLFIVALLQFLADWRMGRGIPRCLLLLLFLLVIPVSCVFAAPASSRYLFVWAMQARHPGIPAMAMKPADISKQHDEVGLGKDFIAVFDVDPGVSFGNLVAMLPVGDAVQAHHTNYEMPVDGFLYANDWLGGDTYVFDLRDPLRPHLARKFAGIGEYSHPHSFVHLPNGNTLATFQYSGGFNHAAGGLVEFDPKGRVVRTASAISAEDSNIRPYSLAVDAKDDRIVTSSADMMAAQVSHVVQVWRLSDLKLLKTLPLPPSPDWYYDTAADSSEPRLLADGATVVVPTFNCGLFLLQDLASDHPELKHVYDFGYRGCEVPVIAGDFMIEAMQSGHAIVSLDLHDPQHPREVDRILLPPDEYPHWVALEPGGDRLAITGYGGLNTRIRFATIDRRNGKLTLDPAAIDMTRTWPDGWRGSAIPHGVVFGNP